MDEQIMALTAQQQFEAQSKNFMAWCAAFFTLDNLFKLLGAVVVIFIIWLVYRLLLRGMKKIPAEKLTAQSSVMMRKILKYLYVIVVILYVMSCLGIKLSALLGAAGIVGLAIGFAAQTTASNLISGLFVITEGSIHIGDFIVVGDVTGIVDSLDLLSTRVHTLDNQMVRIPNSSIINSNLQNNSYFPQRRITFAVCVRYGTDIKHALDSFLKAPALCPKVLGDPAPAAWVDGFADNNVNITVAVWCKSSDFIPAKNEMFIALQKVMDENGLVMSYNTVEIMCHDDNVIKVAQKQA